jgi:hypothetical protein
LILDGFVALIKIAHAYERNQVFMGIMGLKCRRGVDTEPKQLLSRLFLFARDDNQSNEIFTDIDNYNNSYNENNQSISIWSYAGWGSLYNLKLL